MRGDLHHCQLGAHAVGLQLASPTADSAALQALDLFALHIAKHAVAAVAVASEHSSAVGTGAACFAMFENS